VLLGLDAWIISLEKRKSTSTVMERYDHEEITKAIQSIIRGQTVYPPVYDPATRRRIRERCSHGYRACNGVLIAEGVIALALQELLSEARLKIFVDAGDDIRSQRVYEFYRTVKSLEDRAIRELIHSREDEEVRFIQTTSKWADCIFDGGASL
jgi:uridine kinase